MTNRFIARAEIIWEKGTNRAAFFRGDVDKYGWIDMGSSFLPSEIIAAFLWAQLEALEDIQQRRLEIWNAYHSGLKGWNKGKVEQPEIPAFASNNAHMYYLVFPDLSSRSGFIQDLRKKDILPVFHYQNLHKSPFYTELHGSRPLPECERYSDCLVRLPFYYTISEREVIQNIRADGMDH